MLSDPEKRKIYDEEGMAGLKKKQCCRDKEKKKADQGRFRLPLTSRSPVLLTHS